MQNRHDTHPKHWNTVLTVSDEVAYVDYEDEAKTKPTCVKFKTDRIKQWQNAIKRQYSCADKKINSSSDTVQHVIVTIHGKFTVNYYTTTGVVCIQGTPSKLPLFKTDILPPIQMSLPKRSRPQNKGENEGTVNASQSPLLSESESVSTENHTDTTECAKISMVNENDQKLKIAPMLFVTL